jgi:hypothetical protein
VGRGGAAGGRVPACGVLGSRFAWRVGGVGYLSLKQFHSSRKKEAMGLEEQLLKGLALYLWVVFVLWATRHDWV